MQAISSPGWSGGGDTLAPGERLPIVVGETVGDGGKYHVDRILGMGGMAVVAAATHTQLGQRVALKVMRQPRTTAESIERFLTEARAAVSLKSHNVAKVLDVGTLPSGLPYMVMELLEGLDFASILEQGGALPPHLAISYVLQACDAIAEAHRYGIVHRDLKPENLFLTQGPDGAPLVKVLDFGISKITPASVQITDASGRVSTLPPQSRPRTVTHESTLMGSPMYMSPEQVRSAKDVDARADIWALGAILFELVTAQRAFEAENVADIFVKILEKPAPSLDAAAAETPGSPPPPPGLSMVIAHCLERDRTKRFESIAAFANALVELNVPGAAATSHPSLIPSWNRVINNAVDNGGASAAVLPIHAATRTFSETFVLPGRRTARWPFAIVAMLLVLVAGGGVLALRHRAQRKAKVAAAAVTATATTALSADPSESAAPPPPVTVAATTNAAEPAPSGKGPRRKNGSRVKSNSSTSPSNADPPTAPSDPAPAASEPAKRQRTEW